MLLIVALILLLRSRLLSFPKRSLARSDRLSQQELALVLQQVYVKGDHGTKTLLIPYRDHLSKVHFYHFTCISLVNPLKGNHYPNSTFKIYLGCSFLPSTSTSLQI